MLVLFCVSEVANKRRELKPYAECGGMELWESVFFFALGYQMANKHHQRARSVAVVIYARMMHVKLLCKMGIWDEKVRVR